MGERQEGPGDPVPAVTPPRRAAAAAAVVAMAMAALALGAPGAAAQGGAAAAANEMARLYGMALEDDEMRSHLPDRLQMQMGKRPFMYENLYYCWGGCMHDTRQSYEGFWDHEAYRRSIGEDMGAVCARAYYDFVARVGWLRDGAYWMIYLGQCHGYHSDYVNRDFAPLVGGISRECEMKVIEGWFVVAGGEFRRHGMPAEADRTFVLEKPPHIYPDGTRGPTELQFAYFTSECLEEDSGAKAVADKANFPHSDTLLKPHALPPEYSTTDPLGDWAETPEAREARELGSRLAELYEDALESAEVRSHLPRKIQDAISLDVPETYYVDDAWTVDIPGSGNKYHPLAHIFPDSFSSYVRVSHLDPQFCGHRPDLQALCG